MAARKPKAKRSSIRLADDHERRIAELAEMRAQMERVSETSQRMRQRLEELARRFGELTESRPPKGN